jgi:hypothetical protein
MTLGMIGTIMTIITTGIIRIIIHIGTDHITITRIGTHHIGEAIATAIGMVTGTVIMMVIGIVIIIVIMIIIGGEVLLLMGIVAVQLQLMATGVVGHTIQILHVHIQQVLEVTQEQAIQTVHIHAALQTQ